MKTRWLIALLLATTACYDRAGKQRERQLSTQSRDLATDGGSIDTTVDTSDIDVPIATTKPVIATFTITDSGYLGPDTLVGGVIDLRVTNRGKKAHEFRLVEMRLPGTTQPYMDWVRDPLHTRVPPTFPRAGIGPLLPGASSNFILTEGPGEYVIQDMMPVGDGKLGRQVGLLRPLRLVGNAPAQLQPPIMPVQNALLASDLAWRFGFAVTTSGRRSLLVEGRNRRTDLDAGRQLTMMEFLGNANHNAVIIKSDDPFVMREYVAWIQGRRPEPPAGLVTGIPGLYPRMRLYMWLNLTHGGYIVFCPVYHDGKRGYGYELGEYSQFIVR